MKRHPLGPRDRKALLTDEDEALWQHIAGSLDPVQRLKDRVHPVHEESLDAYMAGRAEPLPGRAPHNRPVHHHSGGPAPLAPKKAPPLAEFNRKSARRLRAGQLEIEARIDLHGMRQSEAHAALRRFILHCHHQDRRWVLVITGKGGPCAGRTRHEHWDHASAPRHASHDWAEPERGVLRRNVPIWLAEPDLRAIVVSFTTAAISHGGEGALYIQLRSRLKLGG